MPKATKKNKEHPTSDDESFTSSSNPKRVKRCHQLTTTTDGKKNRQSTSKSRKKVKNTTKKSKKTLPRTTKGNLSEETTPPTKMTKKGKGNKRFDQHQDPVEEMSTGTVTEPDLSSTSDSSSVSTIDDQESQ